MKPDEIVTSLLIGKYPDVPVWELNKAAGAIEMGLAKDSVVFDAKGVSNACMALNEGLHFELTKQLGAAWFGCHSFYAKLAKHYAQALINLSLLKEADDFLAMAIATVQNNTGARLVDVELVEYQGLKARIRKQQFVNERDPNKLVEAFDAYYAAYLANQRVNYWHGVNAVALLARADRDGLSGFTTVQTRVLAQRLSEVLLSQGGVAEWEMASMSEVCLALGDADDAELWLYRLLYAPARSAFMLDSYARQLREIWGARGLDNAAIRPQDRLAAIIAKHQMTRFSVLSITPPISFASQTELERNFSGAGAFSVSTIKRILSACASIGCVCNSDGVRLGTGFLVNVSTLGMPGEGQVFVTNAHVLSASVEKAIHPDAALVTFELAYPADGKPVFHKIKEIIFSSPPGPLGHACEPEEFLDVTVARLEGDHKCIGLDISGGLPIVDGQAKAYVIGHPRGSGLQIAVHDSELLAIDDFNRLVHYRTPTDPGSSGSPVFNEDWRLIALHHGGSAKMPRFRPKDSVYQANEGVTIEAIRAGIRLAGATVIPAPALAAANRAH